MGERTAASREEIQQHLDRLNAFWCAYELAEDLDSPALRLYLNDAWMKEVQWLAAHQISDVALYDPEKMEFRLPDVLE